MLDKLRSNEHFVDKYYFAIWNAMSSYLMMAYSIGFHLWEIEQNFIQTNNVEISKNLVLKCVPKLREKLVEFRKLFERECNEAITTTTEQSRPMKVLFENLLVNVTKLDQKKLNDGFQQELLTECSQLLKQLQTSSDTIHDMRIINLHRSLYLDTISEIKVNIQSVSVDIMDKNTKEELVKRCEGCRDLILEFPFKI